MKTPEHKDFLGRTIKVGDVCVISGGKGQYCGFSQMVVDKLNPKRVRFAYTVGEGEPFAYTEHRQVEPSDCLVINSLLEPK